MPRIENKLTFENFLLHPASQAKNRGGKCGLVALSVLFGIVTLGIVHGAFALKNRFSKGGGEQGQKVQQAAAQVLSSPEMIPKTKFSETAFAEEQEPNLDIMLHQKEEEEPPQNLTKYFKTVATLREGDVGDYRFEKIGDSPYLKLKIKDETGKELVAIIRESTKFPGHYRLIINTPNGKFESPTPMTAAQISSMLRWSKNPPPGFRVSALSGFTLPKMGIFIFSDADNKRYIVDHKGIMSEITDMQALIKYAERI